MNNNNVNSYPSPSNQEIPTNTWNVANRLIIKYQDHPNRGQLTKNDIKTDE